MKQDRREIPIAGCLGRLVLTHQPLRNRKHDVINACIHKVFEKDLLRTLLLMDPGIVGQIIGDGLISMTQIAGTEWSVHHFHR